MLVGDLQIEAAQATISALPVVDLSGGLCLTDDGFSLLDNQTPDACNVEIRREGGICRRKELGTTQKGAFPAKVCHLWQGQFEGGDTWVYASLENGEVWRMFPPTGQIEKLDIPVASQAPECCWRGSMANEKMYFYNGVDAPWVMASGGLTTALDQEWNDETLVHPETGIEVVDSLGLPVTGYETPNCGSMPIGKYGAFFRGYFLLADVWDDYEDPCDPGDEEEVEGGDVEQVRYCNRIRVSYPIQGTTGPEDWNSQDYFEINDGVDGDCIVGMQVCGGSLYVFKRSSVYQVDFDSNGIPSWTQILNKVGAVSCDAIYCTGTEIFFFDQYQGPMSLSSEGASRLGSKLDRAWKDCSLTGLDRQDARIVVCDQKLYLTFPNANVTFVQDLGLQNQPWMKTTLNLCSGIMYRPTEGCSRCLFASGASNYIVEPELATTPGFDDYGGGVIETIPSWYVTNWYGSSSSAVSNPFSKKEVCRLDATGSGDVFVDFYGDNNTRNGIAASSLNFPEDDDVDSEFCLDESTLASAPLVYPGLDRDPVPSRCFTTEGDCLATSRTSSQKYRSACVDLPNALVDSVQLRFTGQGDWCVCTFQLMFREFAQSKGDYEKVDS